MDYMSLLEFDSKSKSKTKDMKKETAIPEKKVTSNRAAIQRRSRSKSPKQIVESVMEEPVNHDIPSRQYGDLYCSVCDSHMNSDQMWENHISGKRHLKNSRKGDTVEQKYEYSSEEPSIQKTLDKETRPIAGLDHMCEIQRNGQPPIYQCFLCSASLTTSKLLMEHILGLKHQMAFLKEHDKERFALVDHSNLNKSYLEPIINDLMSKYEEKHGRGKMAVKKEKKKPGPSHSYKRSNDEKGKNSSKAAKTVPSISYPVTKSARHSPPRSRYSPPKSSRYSPPKSSRYSPPKSSRYSPPKSSRYSPPPKSSRFSSPPPKSSRFSSPPSKSARNSERHTETEWKKVSSVRERSRDREYSDRSPYSDEEHWRKIDAEYDTSYRRAHTHQETSGIRSADNYSRAWPSSDSVSDLRAVLEQKKNLGIGSTAARSIIDVPESISMSSKLTEVTDSLLEIVNKMTPELFLKLTVFKLENMDCETELEFKLLDCVTNKYLEVRKKKPSSNLKKFEETLAHNGIPPQGSSQSSMQYSERVLDDFIGQYKAQTKKTDSYSSYLNPLEQYIDNVSLSHQELNNSSVFRRTPERPSTYNSEVPVSGSEWNQRQSTSLYSFSSTPSCIPGLTLTENPPLQPPPAPSSAMSRLTETARNYFGELNVSPSNPFPKDDINRLSYRF